MKTKIIPLLFLTIAALCLGACGGGRGAAPETAPAGETAQTEAYPLPDSLGNYPDWVPEKDVYGAYCYACYRAAAAGYGCADHRAEVESAEYIPETAELFCADGTGFLLYTVDAGMNQRYLLLLGTEDAGETWQVWPEAVHISTYPEEPVQNGDTVYFRISNALDMSESILVLNRNGTEPETVFAEDLLPQALMKPECNVCVGGIAPKADGSVDITLSLREKTPEAAETDAYTFNFPERLA